MLAAQEWIWDETVGAFKDGVKDKVIEFVDDKIFQGIPVAEKGVEIFEVVTNIKDEITEEADAVRIVYDIVVCIAVEPVAGMVDIRETVVLIDIFESTVIALLVFHARICITFVCLKVFFICGNFFSFFQSY